MSATIDVRPLAKPEPGLPPIRRSGTTAFALAPFGSAYAVPRVFAARIDCSGWPLLTLTIDTSEGEPRVTHLLEERRGLEDEVESRARVPRARLKRIALAAAAVPREIKRTQRGLVDQWVYFEARGSVYEEVLRELRPARRKRVTDAELRADASVIVESRLTGDERPDIELASRLEKSPSTAKRRISRAKTRGLL